MVVVFDLCGHAKPAPGHADPWSITSIPEPAFQPHAQLSTAPGTTAVPPMIFSDAAKKTTALHESASSHLFAKNRCSSVEKSNHGQPLSQWRAKVGSNL